MLHESLGHDVFKKLARLPQARHVRRQPPPGQEAGLNAERASRSASMALKASAHSEPRGALCSISCHMSAVGSRILLADADDKQKVSAMSAEAIGSWS